MRGTVFAMTDEKQRDEMFKNVSEQVKGSKYSRDYELRDIVLNTWENKGEYCMGIVISDNVAVEFGISSVNTTENGEMSSKVYVTSGILPNGLVIPNKVRITIEWKEDSINRYKVVKLHSDEIKEMIRDGKGPEEIEKRFGIPLNEEECKKLMEKK